MLTRRSHRTLRPAHRRPEKPPAARRVRRTRTVPAPERQANLRQAILRQAILRHAILRQAHP
jgi:uncharacterized protein YjbI with pentapeptide repeats